MLLCFDFKERMQPKDCAMDRAAAGTVKDLPAVVVVQF